MNDLTVNVVLPFLTPFSPLFTTMFWQTNFLKFLKGEKNGGELRAQFWVLSKLLDSGVNWGFPSATA